MQRTLGVKKIKLHPKSGIVLETGPYDIALLKMKAKVTYGPKIFPACVPGPDYRYETGKLVTTTGWGLTQSDPIMQPTVLQELDMTLVSKQYCKRYIENGCKDGAMLAITSIFDRNLTNIGRGWYFLLTFVL